MNGGVFAAQWCKTASIQQLVNGGVLAVQLLYNRRAAGQWLLNGGGKFILLINVCIENNVFSWYPSKAIKTGYNQS